MKTFTMIAAALFSMIHGASPADEMSAQQPVDDVSAKLKGTWIQTVQFRDSPRALLTFEGKNVRFENLSAKSGSAEYKVTKKNDDGFSITFEYSYKVKRGNGHIVEYTDRPELFFHVENGRPILSEMIFECDGRGQIIMNEYLRRDDFVDGFRSELCHKLNDRPAVPTMMME